MGEVAASYVTIYPKITADFSRQIETQIRKQTTGAFGPVEKQSDESGKKSGKKFGDSFRSVAAPILTMAAIGAVAKFVDKAVGDFSELEDATAAASVVFGDSMDKIQAQADKAAESIFMSKQETIDAAMTFGTYGKSAGLAGDELADFSTELVQLAGDMASFRGTSTEQAVEAIGAAMRGEMEPIRTYSVMLDDATLRNRAFAMGLISTTKDALTPQQKVLAAHAEILAQTTDAQGDAARTADSTANVQKRLAKESANLSAEIGQKLAPAIVAAQKAGIGFLRFITDNQAAIVPLVGTMGTLALAVGGFVAVAKGIEALKAAKATLVGLGDAFQAMGTKAKIATASMGGIGLAVTAAAAVYGLFAQQNANAQAAVDDFTAALEASNGALDANLEALARKRLEDAGALVAAQQLGLGLDIVTSAALGNADAIRIVNERLAESDAKWAGAASSTTEEAKATGTLRTALGATNTALGEAQDKYDRLSGSTKGSTGATKDNTGATKDNTGALVENVVKLNDVFNARLKLRGDRRSLEAAFDDATKAAKENGKTLDINTEKGRANQSALDGIAESALAVKESMIKQQKPTKDVDKVMDDARKQFIKAATAMGKSKEEAEALADKLGLIKSKHVTVKVTWDLPSAAHVKIDGATLTVGTKGGRFALGGQIPGVAAHDYDDKVRLASGDLGVPGEWVIRRAAVRMYGPAAMAAINAGRAQVRYAEGGQIGSGIPVAQALTADAIGAAVARWLATRGVSMLTIADGVQQIYSSAYEGS